MGGLIKKTPVMWGPLYVGIALLVMLGAIIYLTVHHKRFLPPVRDPEELRARLAGEYHASSDEDWSVESYGGLSAVDELDLVDVSSGQEVRRRPAEVAHDEIMPADDGFTVVDLAGPSTGGHPKQQ